MQIVCQRKMDRKWLVYNVVDKNQSIPFYHRVQQISVSQSICGFVCIRGTFDYLNYLVKISSSTVYYIEISIVSFVC